MNSKVTRKEYKNRIIYRIGWIVIKEIFKHGSVDYAPDKDGNRIKGERRDGPDLISPTGGRYWTFSGEFKGKGPEQ